MRTRSLKERLLHAVGFETVAILTASPVAALIMNKPLFQMGAVALMLSTLAMVWNIIYNALFDRFFPPQKPRALLVRLVHALCFEGGFITIGLPLAAYMLNIGLLQAFMLEIGFFIFFLPYTMIYNWLWDRLREKWFSRRTCMQE
ncbi:multidrug/biocide efflux PACE transporter [Mixta intestinalis]|uniref:Chlorhexidine efflux transporter domain-containing protein n=1 Tax=Mixta intestinalis TaxID=1615494 RepID=A0A6P1PV64_9GAMM|nr:multidrug/biocide efflux PACE transporter [Mixta intestinalis]QHM70183.1 hypothetical protein C7M51_00443 [Mixta intestinalis]